MAKVTNNHDHVDLVTLEQVHQLLKTTDFATVNDLMGAVDLAGVTVPARASKPSGPIEASGSSPLPRRR